MEIKHWLTQAMRDGKSVELLMSTSDGAINLDLAEKSSSLILMARTQIIPHVPTNEENHRDLARGAFGYYVSTYGVKQAAEAKFYPIQEFSKDNLPSHSFGCVRVYERTVDG